MIISTLIPLDLLFFHKRIHFFENIMGPLRYLCNFPSKKAISHVCSSTTVDIAFYILLSVICMCRVSVAQITERPHPIKHNMGY